MMHPVLPRYHNMQASRLFKHILVWLILGTTFSACNSGVQVLPSATHTPTTTPIETKTPTATIVWFPPTATFTQVPTLGITPIATQHVESGAILFTDQFTEASFWSLIRTTSTSIALGKNVLTLALNQPGGYLFSLRSEPVLRDFYLEITASPNLCRGQDEYGVLMRVSPALEFYRFSLSCDGQTRLDKFHNGKASSPQPWMLSGMVPPGAPSSSRLAVWASGNEMHFFINGELQFTVQDPSLPAGAIGVFARSAGENAVTVSFSDLIVREISP